MKTNLDIKKISKAEPKLDAVWNVILFNCYCHSFDEVVEQIIKAVKCSYDNAYAFARRAEREGQVSIYSGSLSKSQAVASVLSSIGLNVSVAQ